MPHALVTGASGFIGRHLVKLLREPDDRVTCLVRRESNRSDLEPFEPDFCIGDVTDLDSVTRALHGIDVVYHLAGVTKSLGVETLDRVNQMGTRNVSVACSRMSQPPVLVVVSSLAAAGPSSPDGPRRESDPTTPVSAYGRSKLAGEWAARELAAQVPTTVVRPPIVFGEGDRDGFPVFETISRFGIHLAPTLREQPFSWIHAGDLSVALALAAERGQRLSDGDPAQGVYFACDEQVVSFGEFGRMVGRALGRPHAWVVRAPGAAVWAISAVSEAISRIRRQPHILNLDKAREATAGAWTCSAARLRHDTGFRCERTLNERVEQTARWYLEQGWLKPRRAAAAARKS